MFVTPDPARVGPCELLVPEAGSLPEPVVRRLSLLEELAEVARLVLEHPDDTDAAGWLADLLRAAGYPLREGSHDGLDRLRRTVMGTREEALT